MLSLRKISIFDKESFDALSDANPSDSCERSFINTFMWKNKFMYLLDFKGRIIAYHSLEKYLQYPFGKDTSPEELADIIKFFSESGINIKYIFDANPNYFDIYPNASNYFDMRKVESTYDYIYDNEKLLSFSGSKLRKKHNLIRQFEANNPNYKVEHVSSSNLGKVRKYMLERAVPEEFDAMQNAFAYYEALGLKGIVLYGQNGDIASCAIMGKLNKDMYSVHYEKFDRDEHGAPQKIVELEAKELLNMGIKYMNREQDLSSPHLKQAKESWDPARMYERLDLLLK